ncbi:helix-turn-helix domain-containing protein [Microlunatus elymi]|uniref:helix-turn-helix domain-containing protein n=1 Tax=Microlunatus elymi TaxID=2596828 RepID=UPI003898E271
MVAEFEADLIRMRTVEGMRVAKAKGHLRGKLPKLSVRQEAHLVELMNSGRYSTGEAAELFGVARSTVYRAQQGALAKGAGTAATDRDRVAAEKPDPGSGPIVAV